MPKYAYYCDDCGEQFEVWHGMLDRQNYCVHCGQGNVNRIPSIVSTRTVTKSKKNKPGQVVSQTIEETKKEVKEYKRQLSKEMNK